MSKDIAQWVSELVARQRPGFTLEQPFYNDPDIFEHDVQRVIARYWQYAGHIARIPKPGDYFLLNVAGESIIIVHGRDGEIHALSNVCRHRGSLVCLEAEGNAKAFICPYHAWTYGTDGSLISAKTMPDDFNREEYGLRRLPVRTAEGLIYFNLDQKTEDFDSMAAHVEEYFAPYELPTLKIATRLVWTVRANWKLVWENFSECYHCGPAHPEYCSVMAHALADTIGSERTKKAYAEYTEQWKTAAAGLGMITESMPREEERIYACNRHPIKPGSLTQSRDGQPVAPLLGRLKDYDGGTTVLSLYPGHFVTLVCDHAILFRFTPQAAEQTEVELTWMVHPDAVEGKDYDVDELTWVWRVTTDQDKTIVDHNQAGVNSRFYQPGPYADTEHGVKRFIDWYLRQVA